MAFQVHNKTALVTGGGSGICLAFAKLLLSRNCNVLIADLQLTPEAQELVSAKNDKPETGRAVFKQTDVTDWKQLQAAFDATLKEFGGLDIVCPGAGIFDPVYRVTYRPQNLSFSFFFGFFLYYTNKSTKSPGPTSGISKKPAPKRTPTQPSKSTSRTPSAPPSSPSITSENKTPPAP
jgi:NAD(P)-dependent dehydrogenase (short-subunit alcohol dehydrogenase family)